MKNSKLILSLMVGHHALINILLTAFKDNLGKNVDFAMSSFEKFKWELEKHIFAEEKVIFEFCSEENSDTCRLVQELAEQHDNMLDLLYKVRSDLAGKERIDTSEFEELLDRHRQIEEESLYPELDRTLTKEQKETIVKRVNEIPIKSKVI